MSPQTTLRHTVRWQSVGRDTPVAVALDRPVLGTDMPDRSPVHSLCDVLKHFVFVLAFHLRACFRSLHGPGLPAAPLTFLTPF